MPWRCSDFLPRSPEEVDKLLSERIDLDGINARFDLLADGKTVRTIIRL